MIDPTVVPTSETPDEPATDEVTIDRTFWEDSFLAVLPFAMQAQGWTVDEKIISTGNDRIDLAAQWADAAAVAHAKRFPFISDSKD
jgi:hypothetical protein